VLSWAVPVLNAAADERTREYEGHQIEYNTSAIAGLGLASLYLKDGDAPTRDALLCLASRQHPAVMNAFRRNMVEMARFDGRLPCSLLRVGMSSAIHPWRGETKAQTQANQAAYEARVEAAIRAEIDWLNGNRDEPAWPTLPVWPSRPRRGIRLGGDWPEDDADPRDQRHPDEYVDQHALGSLVDSLVGLTVGELPAWVVVLSAHLMKWTDRANGPHGDNDCESDNRPSTWNTHFFDFLGILAVALPHDELVTSFLGPITQFKDEAFHDAMSSFLRGFDAATMAHDTKKPKKPAAVRELLAARIRETWNYHRLGREKSSTSESHAADALSGMFYHPGRFAPANQPHIPKDWGGIHETMPVLTALVVGAPPSGYLTERFLSLVETSHNAAFLPYVTQATMAWCSAYGVDSNFWSASGIGSRVCTWLEQTLAADRAAPAATIAVAGDLMKCLDILVRSGVAQARAIEDRIAAIVSTRKTA
jgi:hypothetical protein